MESKPSVNKLKRQLDRAYKRFGQLTHPEVVRASQRLDRALNELNARSSSQPVSKE